MIARAHAHTLCPISALVKVDFPAFGAPTTAARTILCCSFPLQWETVGLSVESFSGDAFVDHALVMIGNKRDSHLVSPTIRLNSSEFNADILH